MDKHLEQRRKGYLSYFKDGVADGLFTGRTDSTKTFSTYYKQGYDFGLALYNEQVAQDDAEWERKNGRAI